MGPNQHERALSLRLVPHHFRTTEYGDCSPGFCLGAFRNPAFGNYWTKFFTYAWSCSFAAISDNNKKVKKTRAKPSKPISRKGSFKNNNKNGLLSIFRKNLDKPVKKGLMP